MGPCLLGLGKSCSTPHSLQLLIIFDLCWKWREKICITYGLVVLWRLMDVISAYSTNLCILSIFLAYDKRSFSLIFPLCLLVIHLWTSRLWLLSLWGKFWFCGLNEFVFEICMQVSVLNISVHIKIYKQACNSHQFHHSLHRDCNVTQSRPIYIL